MAIQIEASYSKKLGLPNYSSHSFMVSLRAEVTNLRRLDSETSRLYRILQTAVDQELQQTGFLPDVMNYGMINNDLKSSSHRARPNGRQANSAPTDAWACSEKQRDFILKKAKGLKLSPGDLESVAQDLFKLSARQLDRKQASGLIDELFAMNGRRSNGRKSDETLPTGPVAATLH